MSYLPNFLMFLRAQKAAENTTSNKVNEHFEWTRY